MLHLSAPFGKFGANLLIRAAAMATETDTVNERDWQVSDFDFDLPHDLIAQRPNRERSASRLLQLDPKSQSITEHNFPEIENFLSSGDVLVLNDTKVVPARLYAQKQTGGRVEIMVERILDETRAWALLKSSKSPKPGAFLELQTDSKTYSIQVAERCDDLFLLVFPENIFNFLQQHGQQPLPPYITRQPDSNDTERYQTVFAANPGAVAAPTAGLHFDKSLLRRLEQKGVQLVYVTLHVGAGTFQPLRGENVDGQTLHREWYSISEQSAAAINASRARGARIVAVGTTVVRTLESACQNGLLQAGAKETQIFITPGYSFKIVDALLTNFHLPRSSLLMLISAFAGYDFSMRAYALAIERKYRFFSYGDAMFIRSHF